jgi:hypothetical protein
MTLIIQGAENLIDNRVEYAAANGLSPRVGDFYRVPSAPWRKVWHSTESRPRSVADCRTLAIRHRTPPHIWASFEFNWVGQTVPLDLSAYALFHDSGDPETNHAHAIQTEVFGFASEGFSAEKCDWLGRRVLRPILAAGIPIDIWLVAPTTGSDGYGTNGTVRQSWSWWASFDGQCGHANVPGNVHWDPGRADFTRIAQAAVPAVPVASPATLSLGGSEVMSLTSQPGGNRIDLCVVGVGGNVFHYTAPNIEGLAGAQRTNLGGDVDEVSCAWSGDTFVVTGRGTKDHLMYTRYFRGGQWSPTWFNAPVDGVVGPDAPPPEPEPAEQPA